MERKSCVYEMHCTTIANKCNACMYRICGFCFTVLKVSKHVLPFYCLHFCRVHIHSVRVFFLLALAHPSNIDQIYLFILHLFFLLVFLLQSMNNKMEKTANPFGRYKCLINRECFQQTDTFS